jgi:pimeloyl-ACP methyl ester carboxylesterase
MVAKRKRKSLVVTNELKQILHFPTDTVAIDYADENGAICTPQTIIVFVPGNPGLVHWYVPMLKELVNRLGDGFAARGLSYAGHGVTAETVEVEAFEGSSQRDVSVALTINGQIRHKIAFMDHLMQDMEVYQNKTTRFIFLSHSIGSHLVQRMCILRPDILKRALLILHLMPFIRMDAPIRQQLQLDMAAFHPDSIIGVGKTILGVMSKLPREWVDYLMTPTVPDKDGRNVAVNLVRLPKFAKNFFELGTEEIRDIPQEADGSAFRILGAQCGMELLFAGGPDQWAPHFHTHDLRDLQQRGSIPRSIEWTYLEGLNHDFVVHPAMVPPVIEFCLNAIRKVMPQSRL